MQRAVRAIEDTHGARGCAREQRRLQPIGRSRGDPHRSRSRAVRNECVRPVAIDAARVAGNAPRPRRTDRKHRIDGRAPGFSGRRRVPRDEICD